MRALSLFCILLLLHLSAFSQNKAVMLLQPVDSSVAGLSAAESFKFYNEFYYENKVLGKKCHRQYFKYSFDKRSALLKAVKNRDISADSIYLIVNKYKIDTSAGYAEKNTLYVSMCKCSGDSVFMQVNTSYSRAFSDNPKIFISPGVSYPFNIDYEVRIDGVVKTFNTDINIIPTFRSGTDSVQLQQTALELRHKNAYRGEAMIGGRKTGVEIIPNVLQAGFDPMNLSLNVSDAKGQLKKIDFYSTLKYRIGDTINQGSVFVVPERVSKTGDSLYFSVINNPGNWGFTPGYKLSPSLLKSLSDTSKAVLSSTVFEQSDYTLVDFWGSWCEPCIADFPALKALQLKYPRDKFSIVGVASEYNGNTAAAMRILQDKGMSRREYYNNIREKNDFAAKASIIAYPTYLLFNRSGEILFRVGHTGLSEITGFLDNKLSR